MNIYRTAEGAKAVEAAYRGLLDAWPVDSERLVVPTREGDTFVLAFGPKDAPPVLAFHGSGANAARWIGSSVAWAQHLRVYAIDIIGEPGLSAPSRPPLGSEAYVLWLDDVMAGLGLTETSIVGESLGGLIALDYATSRPERVTRLVVLTPSGIGRETRSVYLKMALLSLLGAKGKLKAIQLMLGPVFSRPSKDMAVIGPLMMLITKHFLYRKARMPIFDDARLRRLTMPVLAILGAVDAVLDHNETRRRLVETVPQAEVRMLPEVGHILPDQTAPVLEFLRSNVNA